MPRYNIWIREEDVDKWQAIQDRPQWLHEHLAHTDIPEIETIKRQIDTDLDQMRRHLQRVGDSSK